MNLRIKASLLLLGFIFLYHGVKSNDTDSLRYLRNPSENEFETIRNYQKLGEHFKGKQSDSARKYFNLALERIDLLQNDSLTWQLSGELHTCMASFCIDLGLIDETLFHDSLAFVWGKKTNSKTILAKANNIKGLIHYNTGNYDSAIFYYRHALNLAAQVNDKKLTAKIFTNLGIIKFLQGDCDSALICFEKPLQLATISQDNELLAGSYLNIGLLNYYMGHMQTAEGYYLQSKELYEEMKDYSGLILSLNSLGNIYHAKAEYSKALINYNKIVKINHQIGDQPNLAKAYHNMAEVYAQIGDELNATHNYLLSLEIKEELDDKKGIGADLVGLGVLNSNKGNHSQALLYFEKALIAYRALDYQIGMGTVLGTTASAFLNQNMPDSAISYYEQAINIFAQIDNPQGLSDNYMSLAIAIEPKANYELVMGHYNKAIDLKIKIEDTESLGMAYYNLAKYHNNLARMAPTKKRESLYNKALNYGLQADEIAIEYDLVPLQNYSSKVLTDSYKALGNLAKALYYAEIQNQTTDSLAKLSKTEAATFAEARWQSQRKQQEIDQLNKDKELQQQILATSKAESKQKNTIIIFLITFLLTLTIIGILLSFYLKKRAALKYQKQLNKINMLRFENTRNRLSPHFLFNTLGSITSSLEDKPNIKNKILAITRMLRQSLENIEKPHISLEEEINFVKDYIEVQQNNYSKNVSILWKIDNQLLQRKIPVMALQISAENALKHGLALKTEGEKILCISAYQENNSMTLSISDNGVGRNHAQSIPKNRGTGTGIKVMSQTLLLLNRNNKNLINWSIIDLKDKPGNSNGTKVEITVPNDFVFEI